MRKRRFVAAGVSVLLVTALAACSSSSNKSQTTSSSSGNTSAASQSQTTLKIGLLSDFTGIASSSFSDTDQGANAYINYINSQGGIDGQKLEVVKADTTSTPAGALTAAQQLVQKDHVFAIMENTTFYFAAMQYLLKQNIPVVASCIDGTECADPKLTNVYDSGGINNPDYYPTATGEFMKDKGATSCAVVGNAGVPSVQLAAKQFAASCTAAGLKTAYTNLQLPLGSTDMGAVALAIKSSGADAIYLPIVANSAFSLLTALHQIGAKTKVVMVLSGYGSSLLAQPATVQAGQGAYFGTFGMPAEVSNPGNDLRNKLFTDAGYKLPPTAGQQYGYLNAVVLVAGLKAAGANATPASFMAAMNKMTNFDGDGLLPQPINFRDYTPATSCATVVQLVGNKFVPQQPMPLCAPTAKFSS